MRLSNENFISFVKTLGKKSILSALVNRNMRFLVFFLLIISNFAYRLRK